MSKYGASSLRAEEADPLIRTRDERGVSSPATSGAAAAAAWAAIAALVLIGLYVRHRHASLDGEFQGWGSASCLLMARAFNQLGALHTHFVPFQNNLPVGKDPDVYLHWPPLYPLLLAQFLRLFGDTVFTGRVLQLLISLCSGGVVALIAQRLYNTRIAWLSAFFYFSSRAVYIGAAPLLQQPLAILFALLAVYGFLRAIPLTENEPGPRNAGVFGALGIVATVLMVFSAWDPVFVPFGLLATAVWTRNRRASRLATLYCVAAVLAFVAVELDYVLTYPQLFANQFATIAYRAGLHFKANTSMRLPTFVDAAVFDEHFGVVAGLWRALRFAEQFLSPLGLAACLLFLAIWVRQRGVQRGAAAEATPATWIVGGLFLPALVWYGIMRNYVAIHPFPIILFAPSVAIASAYLLDRLWNHFSGPEHRAEQFALRYLVPAVLLLPLFIEYRDAELTPPPEFTDMSALIQAGTPSDAIVLTPTESLIPTLYSHRHVVRGIKTEAWLAQAIPQAHTDFPGNPVFFAIKDSDRAKFDAGLDNLKPATRRGDSSLYEVP